MNSEHWFITVLVPRVPSDKCAERAGVCLARPPHDSRYPTQFRISVFYFWLVIHIYYLVGFKNRLFVVLQWAWAYWWLEQRDRSRRG